MTAVVCSDLGWYNVYGSTSYSAAFPEDWTFLGNPTLTTWSDALTSAYCAYKTVSVDACDNLSP